MEWNIKKTIKIALLACLFVACGDRFKEERVRHFEPELNKYLEEFRADAQRFGLSVQPSIEIRSLKFRKYDENFLSTSNAIGACVTKFDSPAPMAHLTEEPESLGVYREINLLPYEHWPRDLKNPSNLQIKAVLYHEFAHCYLDMNHSNEIGGTPRLMKIKMNLDQDFLESNWEVLVTNLMETAKSGRLTKKHGYSESKKSKAPAPKLEANFSRIFDFH